PTGFHNRTRRNWWLLLAIAELAGADWADKARKGGGLIEGGGGVGGVGLEVLSDIKAGVEGKGGGEISRTELISALCADEERPWATWTKDKDPIGPKHIGRLLRKYSVTSEDVRPNEGMHAKGYKRVRFEEAWGRYLVPKKHFREN